jgi:hypothetical protein
VGNSRDYFAVPNGGHITAALGWFPTVDNVTSEYSEGGVSSCGTCKYYNYYSLQVNTNGFKAFGMCPNPNCLGWEQFVFENQGNTSGSDGDLQIWYWLFNYAPCASSTCTDTCPSGWQGVHQGSAANPESCYHTSSNADDVQSYAIGNGLRYFRLGGASLSKSFYSDYATLDVYGGPSPQLYKIEGDNIFPALSNYWHSTEFGVYGIGGRAKAVFNGNPTIAERLAVTTVNRTKAAPECSLDIKNGGERTGESNNLKLMQTSSQWPKRNWPAIVFTEGNPTKSPTPSCAKIPAQ